MNTQYIDIECSLIISGGIINYAREYFNINKLSTNFKMPRCECIFVISRLLHVEISFGYIFEICNTSPSKIIKVGGDFNEFLCKKLNVKKITDINHFILLLYQNDYIQSNYHNSNPRKQIEDDRIERLEYVIVDENTVKSDVINLFYNAEKLHLGSE